LGLLHEFEDEYVRDLVENRAKQFDNLPLAFNWEEVALRFEQNADLRRL